MTAAEATLYGALIAGTFTLLGVVVERLIQRRGKVRCKMEPIEIHTMTGEGAEDMHTVRRLPVPADYLPAPDAGTHTDYGDPLVRCAIKAKLFNEKEVKTGLRDVVLAFDGNPPLKQAMKDRSTWRSGAHSIRMDNPDAVNLPSREWITLDLEADIDAKEARLLATCKRAWLRGYYPDDRLFSERVPFD